MTETVAVLGGGVAGLTAAHELAERGFAVTVYEARDRLGGKARSLPVPGSGTDGRGDLPAEHGFRFFPGFYRHVPDTMRRIGVDGPPGRRRARAARPGRRPQRAADARPPAGVARGLRARHPLRARVRDRPRHPAARDRVLPRAAADAAHELRRAPPRPVGAPELVVVRRRRAALAGVPQVPRRRAHAHARGGAGARDERAHRRDDPAAAAVRPHARRRPRRPRARRPDLRRLDRPVGGAHRGPRRRDPPRRAGRGHPDGRRAHHRRDRRGRDGDRGPLRRGRAGRDHAHARRARPARRRAAAQAPRPPGHALDERRHVLPRRGRPGRPRPRHLHRLRVGADLDLPAPVLARLRPRADRRRPRRGDPLGRRLRLGPAEPAARQDRDAAAPTTR